MEDQTKASLFTHFVESLVESDDIRNGDLNLLGKTISSFAYIIQEIVLEDEKNRIANKERFSVFSCLTRHHLEELHTRFLRYLLNPNDTHDCGSRFLTAFIKLISEDEDIKTNKYFETLSTIIANGELENAIVENKDKYIGSSNDSGDVYGKIDIFIETKSMNIVIENKTSYGEQDAQIERYVTYCEEQEKKLGKAYIILYLTPTGWESQEAGGKEYYRISYDKHIIFWLKDCIEKSLEPMVSSGLNYYRKLVVTYVLKQPSNNVIMNMKDLLLKPENRIILKYMNEIESAKEPIRNQLRTDFFNGIFKKLNECNFDFSPYKKTDNIVNRIKLSEVWVHNCGGLQINNDTLVHAINNNQKIYFVIEHNWTNLWYGLIVRNVIEKNEKDQSDIENISVTKSVIEKMNKKMNHDFELPEDGFFSFKYFSSRTKFGFGDDKLNYEFATHMSDIVQQFTDDIGDYLKAWGATINELKKTK